MLNFFQKRKYLFLLFFVVFGAFFVVFSEKKQTIRAVDNKANFYPGQVKLEKGDNSWEGVSNSVAQDLGSEAGIGDFNEKNSAYIKIGAFSVKTEKNEPPMTQSTDATSTSAGGASFDLNEGEIKEIESKKSEEIAAPSDKGVSGNNIAPSSSASDNQTEVNTGAPETAPAVETTPEPAPSPETESVPASDESSAPAPADAGSSESAPSPVVSEPISREKREIKTGDNWLNAGLRLSKDAYLFAEQKISSNLKSWIPVFARMISGEAKADEVASSTGDVIKNDVPRDDTVAQALDTGKLDAGSSLVFRDFSIAGDREGKISSVQLRASIAALSNIEGDKIAFEYRIGEAWEKLGEYRIDEEISNRTNGGYLLFGLPIFESWTELENIEVRVIFVPIDGRDDERRAGVFMDSTWLEVKTEEDLSLNLDDQFEAAKEEDLRVKREIDFRLLSGRKDFRKGEDGKMRFKIGKKRGLLAGVGASVIGLFRDEYETVQFSSILRRKNGETMDVKLIIEYLENGEFEVSLPSDAQLKPGEYEVEIAVLDAALTAGRTISFAQDFSWGVLAYNSNKTVYPSGEKAYLQFAVLNEQGHTLCDAEVEAQITDPSGNTAFLGTWNEQVVRNPECGPNNVIKAPDYYAYFEPFEVGEYFVKVKAHTGNGWHEISDHFEVRSAPDFNIERVGPTRIYPWAGYQVVLSVRANQDYQGQFSDFAPASFGLPFAQEASISSSSEESKISWDVDWKQGEVYNYRYIFDAPNISPEFYTLGPAKVSATSTESTPDFEEIRRWQIASDAEVGNAYATAIGIGATTTDTVNWTSVVSADSTQFTANDKYFVYVSSGFMNNNTGGTQDFEIRYGATVKYTGLIEPAGGTATDVATQVSWFDVFDQPSTATDVTLYQRSNNAAWSCRALNAQIIAINLSDLTARDWEYASSTVASAHTTTLVSKASLTLSDADSVKDWLVFGMEELQVDANNVSHQLQLYDGSAGYMQVTREGENAAEFYPQTVFAPFTDVASNTVFSVQVRDDAGPSNDHLMSRVFALNLDAFVNHKTNYAAPATALGAAWTAVGDLNNGGNYTPDTTGNQFIFSSIINRTQNAAAGTDYRLQVNGVTTPVDWSWTAGAVVDFRSYDATDYLLMNAATRVSIPSTGQTIDLDAMEANGANAQIAQERSITVFSTETNGQMPPTGILNSAAAKTDGSGAVDISFDVDDYNLDNSRIKVEYVAGSACNFATPLDPTLNEATSTISSDLGDVRIDNNYEYQVGTSTGWIDTSAGANTVNFDWNSKTDVPTADGVYCLRLTANDQIADESSPATTTVTIDNVAPTIPGTLALQTAYYDSLVLNFGTSSTDTNFDVYKIFYMVGSGTPDESDSAFDISNDADLGYYNFNGTTNTSVGSLIPATVYSFIVYAYDDYGNVSSSSVFTTQTGPAPRGNTVIFPAGYYSSANGTTGLNSDTNQSFSSFSFRLAETGAKIESAYVIFESHFETYVNGANNYTGYDLNFDACAGSGCTPNAWTGTGRATTTDTSILTYDQTNTSANMVRLLLDVTDEAQLATYGGEDGVLNGQVGFNLKRGAAVNSISFATAKLVLTYIYDADSPSITKTVAYPLESTAAGDSGTRRAARTACSLDGTCPLFDYNMEIPEVSQQLAHWFLVNQESDANAADIYVDVNIEGTDIDSNTFIHESNLVANSTMGNSFGTLFYPVSGFAENTAQQMEYHIYNSGTQYLVGGEVFETYTASSSAAEKTRTVSFPLGVINNGLTNALTSGSVNVYFPENGTASGTVTVKKAWFRLISNNYNSGGNTITVSSKVGSIATSSDFVYDYNAGAQTIRPTFNFNHVIASTTYSELAGANATTPVAVKVNTTNSNNTTHGGTSAELLITYTYSSEVEGYLNSMQVMGFQQGTSPATTTSGVISNVILPEGANNTLLAGALLPSYLIADSDYVIENNYAIGSNLATGTPACTSNPFIARTDAVNAMQEYLQTVTSAMTSNHKETYNVCVTNNWGGDANNTGGAKMNTQLLYTYQHYTPQQMKIVVQEQYKADGLTAIANGAWTTENEVNLFAQARDKDETASVDFYFNLVGTDDEFSVITSAPASSCASGSTYGSCAGKIWTASGVVASQLATSTVNIAALPDSATGYKWQIFACNAIDTCSLWYAFESAPNFLVDNAFPTAPGSLSLATTTFSSVKLNFGASTTEANFSQYKIFYKIGSSQVDEGDTEWIDANLDHQSYNGAADTTITGLDPSTQYVFNIWAYDQAGNKAVATEIAATTKSKAHARGKSISFLAGTFSGNGATGQNSNTDQTFPEFDWRLAETGVEIRSAYVLFEAQFESYTDGANSYTGYDLSFDACQAPCSADAFAGTGKTTINSTSVLAYNESEGNIVRLLADVTSEAQLATYAGDSTAMKAQFGYRLNKGATNNAISAARAQLVVTYGYDDDNSTAITNTVVYPLESTAAGDSGSRRNVQNDDCTVNNNCPTFTYAVTAPEKTERLMQWYHTYLFNDVNNTNDLAIDVNLQTYDVNSYTFYHESALGASQSSAMDMLFGTVSGFDENVAQTLEVHPVSAAGAASYYLLGGEVYDTYTATKTAATKTRTVVLPMGVLDPGFAFSNANASVNVYFPENGGGSGIVDIQKAWFRVYNNDVTSGAKQLSLSSKAGDNATSSAYNYVYNPGATTIKPSFRVIHVIPLADYSELETANATTPKAVKLIATNNAASAGGISAELLITYTYTSETSGYLAPIDIYAGQSTGNANSTTATSSAARGVFPELRGTKTLRASGLVASYLSSDSDAGMPAGNYLVDTNLAATDPSCSNSYATLSASINMFTEFVREVNSTLMTTDNSAYTTCWSGANSGDTSVGAKMNSHLVYTYQYDAPPPFYTQKNWRWYENSDNIEPSVSKADEKTSVSNINLADPLRLRMSVGVTNIDLAAQGQIFKLQFTKSSDCATAVDWTDVGGLADSSAWRGYNNIDPVDGATIGSLLLSDSTVKASYEESNSSASNPNAITVGNTGEWDWALYNNSASSSAQYCFRMIKEGGNVFDDYLSDSYPTVNTAPANTAPSAPTLLGQFRGSDSSLIPNMTWINEDSVELSAAATDPNINETVTLYYELLPTAGLFTTATTTPTGACVYGTAYAACASKVWFVASSSPGDYRTSAYIGTTSITAIPDSATGYKWQVMPCDATDACSSWAASGTAPNFKVDITAPTAPGSLAFSTSTATSITLNLGASSTEANFDRYEIHYRSGSSGVLETDDESTDNNLNFINYNWATQTVVSNLSAGTQYVFNIWAYDRAGNRASSSMEVTGTTISSYTRPTGSIVNLSQKNDGTGAVDVVILADDADNDNTLRAKLEYEAGSSCSFAASNQATIDETDLNTSATYGDPQVDSNSAYQVGTTTGWIETAPGANYIAFDWLSNADIPAANGTFCLRLTVDDGGLSQLTPHTMLMIIDNTAPSTPGALSLFDKNYNSARLTFGSNSTDPRFDEYKIFYKEGITGVTEADTEWIDSHLSSFDYSGATSTLVSGLTPNTNYVFKIWAYDQLGNRASSTEMTFKTNAAPTNPQAFSQMRGDTMASLSNGTWMNTDDIYLRAYAHDQDEGDSLTFYYNLISATGTYSMITTPPSSTCASGVAFNACSGKIWSVATSTYALPTDWYDKAWLYRKKITVNMASVTGTQSDFPFLVKTTDANLASAALANGYDIVFTDASGTSTLPFERESFANATGELAAWVKTGISTATNTVIYMYYGNAQATADMSSSTAVWTNSFSAVWHLDEDVIDESNQVNAHQDATAANKDASQYGNNEMTGQINKAQDFDGDDYIDGGNVGNIRTIALWVKPNTTTQKILELSGAANVSVTAGRATTTGITSPTIYVNGVATTTMSTAWQYLVITTGTNINASAVKLGRVGVAYLTGQMDEVKFSSVARAASWVADEYNNYAAAGFRTISSEGFASSYYTTNLAISLPDSATGYKWQTFICDDDGDCSVWSKFDATTPNFKVDTVAPTAPGQLTDQGKTSASIDVGFGAQTTESNFVNYRIFYGTNSTVTETDTELIDADLNYIDYNNTALTTVENLPPATTHYFNIWAYDEAGNKASSTVRSIATNAVASTPGVIFYTKNTRVLFYKVWTGTAWGGEQSGPTLGSGATDVIRHIRVERSDDGGKILIAAKTWDGTNQEWWATVYRYAANNFVNTQQLGTSYASATYNNIFTGCLGALSGNEFMAVRNNNAADGTLVYSWNATDGWTSEGAGPNPVAVLESCNLIRRPGTDNYLLETFDGDSDTGTSYYYGGDVYSNSWTTWTEHATASDNNSSISTSGYFDPSDNTQGLITYSNSATLFYGYAKYFTVTDTAINFGTEVAAPNTLTDDFVGGEVAFNPGSSGEAYFIGNDIVDDVNVYQLSISGTTPVWTASTNGDNISAGNAYAYGGYSVKPFAVHMYASDEGVALWNSATITVPPYYRKINGSTNTVDAANTAVPGADNNNWSRVRTYDDPNENEFLAVFQNDDNDYSAVFWDGANDRFFNNANNPGSGQIWTIIGSNLAAASQNYENVAFAYATGNQTPNAPSDLQQSKSTGTTTLANQAWSNNSTMKFRVSANDLDTSEQLRIYINVVTSTSTFSATTTPPGGACADGTSFAACTGKIWLVSTSSIADWSSASFIATSTITSFPDSPDASTGYKWQAFVCDDSNQCSSWTSFNSTIPNFKVDTTDPTSPGALTIAGITSSGVTLQFGAQTTEDNFSRYRIFYRTGASGVVETDTEQIDTDLNFKNYNATTNTAVGSLLPSTQYAFNIWAYDLAGNKASSTIVATTTIALANLRQTSFIIENDDGANVNSNTAEVVASTTLTNVLIGQRLNVRIQVENNGGDISSNKIYKLQYQNVTDAGAWTDVGPATQIAYTSGLSGANNDIIASSKASANVRAWMNGSWHEGVNATANFTLNNNAYTEFVFALKTDSALTSKTYRFRLYNQTDNQTLDSYANYAFITTSATDTKRYSKVTAAALPTTTADLTYHYDAQGYNDAGTDNSAYDSLTSVANYPISYFITKHTNNTDAITAVWNGQTTASTSVNNLVLQVYRFGSTNAWTTVTTHATSSANSDFTIAGRINGQLSEYYGASNWTFWRVYQASGSQTLRTDYFGASFAAPISDVQQIHYRWRNNDGDEAGASWRDSEDVADPTGATPALNKNEVGRLRLEAANLGGGTASNYNFGIQYAVTAGSCATDPGGWTTITSNGATNHWRTATSSVYANADATLARLGNIESYTFVTGRMVENPYSTTTAISLSERRYTELEFGLTPTTNATDGGTYCFRLTNSGAALNAYTIYPAITLGGITNTAPSFTAAPSDNGSASTSPTNYGTDIVFTATADDAESDNYYLAVCKTAAITPGNNAAPTCTGGSWCVSDLASSTAENTCSYNATDAGENLNWYAYVCDKYAGFGIAKCSAYSQGEGNPTNDSPFNINHRPTFTSVTSTNSPQAPGGTFNITTVSSDADVYNGDDTLYFYVCKTNSASFGGCTAGAGDTICSATATSSPNAACSFTDTAPTPSGNTTYYAFVFDSHGLAASANSRSSSYTISNVAPVLGGLSLNGGADIYLNIKGMTDKSISTVNMSVVDQNGCQTGLQSATAVVYMSGAVNGENCTANDNDCYQIAMANCAKSDCVDDNDASAVYTCSTALKYFANPTDSQTNNPYSTYKWLSRLQVYDGANYSATTSPGVELITSYALDVPETYIDFGSEMFAGTNTGSNNSTTTVDNAGNCPIDTRISGTNMSGTPSGLIMVNNIEWKNSTFGYGAGTDLTSGGQNAQLYVPKPTAPAGQSKNMYWGLGVPYGVDASTYYGSNTFQVLYNETGW